MRSYLKYIFSRIESDIPLAIRSVKKSHGYNISDFIKLLKQAEIGELNDMNQIRSSSAPITIIDDDSSGSSDGSPPSVSQDNTNIIRIKKEKHAEIIIKPIQFASLSENSSSSGSSTSSDISSSSSSDDVSANKKTTKKNLSRIKLIKKRKFSEISENSSTCGDSSDEFDTEHYCRIKNYKSPFKKKPKIRPLSNTEDSSDESPYNKADDNLPGKQDPIPKCPRAKSIFIMYLSIFSHSYNVPLI